MRHGKVGSEDRASGRTGFQQPDRLFGSGFDTDEAAARMHHENGSGDIVLAQARDQAVQIVRNLGLHIGIGNNGVEALEFTHLRGNDRRKGNRQIRHGCTQRIGNRAFVGAVGIGVQESDRHRLVSALRDGFDHLRDFGRIQRQQHGSIGSQPLVQREAILARDQRFRQFKVQIILFEPVFRPHFNDIAKAFCRDEGEFGAASLDQCICHQRGAVNHLMDRAGRHAGRLGRADDPVEDRLFRLAVIGQHLAGRDAVAMLKRHIRKRAADVNANPVFELPHDLSLPVRSR